MKTNLAWDLGPGVGILSAERIDGRWIILARREELGSCPAIAHVLIPGGVGIGQELAWLRKFDSGIAS
jgi:hypothetical protein